MPEKMSVLVVDDDAMIRDLLPEILTGDRFDVSTAATGAEGLEAARRRRFAIVVTDLKLPDIDGTRLLKTITAESPGTVVLAMTGKGTIRDAVKLMREGAFDVLPKPFGIDELKLAIEKAGRHHEFQQSHDDLKRRVETSEKMAAIGRLAAGVAHELNNPLDGVLRFVNLSLDQLHRAAPAISSVAHYLEDAKTGLKRMADIVKTLLSYSRNVAVEHEPQELRGMLTDVLTGLSHCNGRSLVQVRQLVPARGLLVPSGLYQVLANLVKNAFDAMESGGVLTLFAREEGEIVVIEVTDSGVGISDEAQKRIFEPFFTTKPVGKGTGLGLAITAQIVERFGGTIRVESRVGAGTTFRVTIPRPPAGGAGVAPPTGMETGS